MSLNPQWQYIHPCIILEILKLVTIYYACVNRGKGLKYVLSCPFNVEIITEEFIFLYGSYK
jgi:hypothetical protein